MEVHGIGDQNQPLYKSPNRAQYIIKYISYFINYSISPEKLPKLAILKVQKFE